VALPISTIILFISFFIFIYLIKKNKNIDQVNWQNISLEKLPTMSKDEVKVLLIFILTVCAWVFRGYLNQFNFLSNLTDSGIAITSAFLFFLIPSSNKKNDLLQWRHMKQLPWGLLLLFGGGLALAKAIMVSGLGDWFGSQLTFLNNFSVLYIIFILIFATVFLTEVLSNTALTITFLPIISVLAIDLGFEVGTVCMVIVLSTSCAFMLPNATPPNAVIFATEKIKVVDMVKVGFILNIFTIFIITSIFFFFLEF
jgi:sodium-dependent dicarboxylate transporter 2/3/5